MPLAETDSTARTTTALDDANNSTHSKEDRYDRIRLGTMRLQNNPSIAPKQGNRLTAFENSPEIPRQFGEEIVTPNNKGTEQPVTPEVETPENGEGVLPVSYTRSWYQET